MQKNHMKKIQHSIEKKNLSKLGIVLYLIKTFYKKSPANIILNDMKLKAFPSKIRCEVEMFPLTIPVQHDIRNCS